MAKPVKGEHCLNCGTATGSANYCSQCGQLNDTRRLSFWELVSESLSNFLAIDGKIFRTLWRVLAKPGKVATDFKNGMRVTYMNPIRFYFLSSLLLITSIQLNRSDVEIIRFKEGDQEYVPKKKDPSSTSSIERSLNLARISEDYKALEDPGLFERLDYLTDYLEESPQSSKAEIFGSLGMEDSFWNDFLYDQALKIEQSRKEGDFSKFNNAFINKLFWILFLFIPVFGLILQLVYWRRDFYYPEHLFFTLYQQSLFFLGASIYNLFFRSPNVLIILMLGFGIHLLLAMRRFYQQSWRKTIFKFVLINISGIFTFGLFFILSAIVVFILL